MYNTNFLPLLERTRRHLFGSRDPRNLDPSIAYSPPPDVKILECEEDTNGEWVPKRGLEERADRST